jgi:hypothetical protein
MKSKPWIVWLVVTVSPAFIGMNIYQISYPDWSVQCVGGSAPLGREFACLYDYADVERYIDDAGKRGMGSCKVKRSRKCRQAWLTPHK